MTNSNFFSKMLPYAIEAHNGVGGKEPVSVILAQWAVESARGTSRLALESNNYGGIKYVPGLSIAVGKDSGGVFARYDSLEQFTQDYIRVMNLSYYEKVRNDSRVEQAVKDLAASPYDAGHYNGTGQSLLDTIDSANLRQYDDPAAAEPDNMAKIGLAVVSLFALVAAATNK